jgi:hypothetical protein
MCYGIGASCVMHTELQKQKQTEADVPTLLRPFFARYNTDGGKSSAKQLALPCPTVTQESAPS